VFSWEIISGDALLGLRGLSDESVQCCVTSPPYWRLRDYGVSGQIGQEETPEEYVRKLTEVFREVRRVLRSDGTLWLVLGDCFNAAGRNGHGTRVGALQGTNRASREFADIVRPTASSLKPKDLIGIPWMVAFALRDDGWYLRSDIVWSKPNPMPESVEDRPTRSHEYIFLLTKSERYFYDHVSAMEPAVGQSKHDLTGCGYCAPVQTGQGGNRKSRYDYAFGGDKNAALFASGKNRVVMGRREPFRGTDGFLRNRRDVWLIPGKPFKGAHFAVFPEKLIEPCILAGTSGGGSCFRCGFPQVRLTKVEKSNRSNAAKAGMVIEGKGHPSSQIRGNHDVRNGPCVSVETVGWSPGCDCRKSDTVPCLVLDPFAGSGTTGVVSGRTGRNFLGIEINSEYVALARDRIRRAVPRSTERRSGKEEGELEIRVWQKVD
jgi:DNA modification methylase